MKPYIRTSAFVLCAMATCFFSQGANAVAVNVTVLTDDTVTIPTAELVTHTPIVSPLTFGTTLSPVHGTLPQSYVSPFGDITSPFTSVEGPPNFVPSSAAFSLGTGNELQIFWGSVNSYNTLAFYTGNTLVGSLTGNDLFHAPTGNGHDLVSLLVGGLFDTVVVSTTMAAFEFANPLVSCVPGPGVVRCGEVPLATPLPAALPLFISGIAGLGGLVGWRKRRKAAKAIAA